MKPHIVLHVYHDGDRVVNLSVMNSAGDNIDFEKVDALLVANPPPQARGSVASLVNVNLPNRHPRRTLTYATSIHSTRGPRWALNL